MYRPRVRYRYQVGETYYHSERLTADALPSEFPSGGSHGDAAAVIKRWPTDSEFDVRYDPERPEYALPAREAAPSLAELGQSAQRVGLGISVAAIMLRLL